MTRRLLTSTVARLFVVATGGVNPPLASGGDEPPGLVDRLERIGRLPADLVKAKKTDAEIAEALCLAALSRLPSDAEKEIAAKHLAGAKNREEAARDLA